MYTMRTQRERLWIKYDIEKIGVREFRSELPKYIYGETPVEVLRHGHTVGFYFPVKHEDDIVREFRQMCEADRANQRKDLDK